MKNATCIKYFLLLLLAIALWPNISIAQGSKDAVQASNNIAIVQTESGKVKGYIHKGIVTFKGIPYAHAERFMPPSKPAPWQGVRSSMTYGPVCPTDVVTEENDEGEFPFQHNLGYANENCLNLNVWTQKVNDNKKRPVMVWFHGGGYTNGSSIEQPGYDGESLSRKGDVVVVSVNHRLNVLGFLDLSAYGDKYKYSANAGMEDLVAALQWVKQNISAFGGDPGNVTIFGQSGGGGKVTCLMNAPSAKGLFHKAIVQSGSWRSDFAQQSITRQVAAATLKELGLQPSQVDSLQTMPYERLYAAAKRAMQDVQESLEKDSKHSVSWEPSVDGNFLPYQPNELAAIELSKNIPLLIGTTKNEFAPFDPSDRGISMDSVKKLVQKKYGDKATEYMTAVKKAYPNTTIPSDFLDVDFRFRAGAIRQADAKVATGTAPVYMYLFAWQSPVNDGIYKAMHCIEIPFVFNNIARCEEMTGGGPDAYSLADKVSGAWLNFARTGNPNYKELPTWQAYTPESGATMIFDNKCEIKQHHDKELLQFKQ